VSRIFFRRAAGPTDAFWREFILVSSSLIFLCFSPFLVATPQKTVASKREELILQIQQFIADQNLERARVLMNQAGVQYPADGGFDNLRGILDAREGNYSGAEKSFALAIKRQPRFTGAYLNLGRLYQENAAKDLQAWTKAEAIYRRLLEFDSANREARYQLATLLMLQGQYRESLSHLSLLPQDVRGSTQALAVSCADYAGIGDAQRTTALARQMSSDPKLTEADLRLVSPALVSAKRDDLLIQLYVFLSKLEPLTPSVLGVLGLAYERNDRLAEARESLERAFAAGTPSAKILVDLARIAHEQKDYRGSLGYLAHASDLEPGNASLHYDFALVCLDLDLLSEARTALDKAVKLDPENPSYNYAMGAVSVFYHDPADAVPYFQKYVKLRPNDSSGKLALGAAFVRAKDFDSAVPWLKEALQSPETSVTAHYYLGRVAREQRNLDEAISLLQEVLSTKRDYPDALAELGQCYLLMKDYPRAEQYFNQALKSNPDHYTANFNLLTLYRRTGDSRSAAQQARFDELQARLEEKSQEFRRVIEVRPLDNP